MDNNGSTHANGNSNHDSAQPSALGIQLKEISDRALASGTTTLTNDEILRRIAEARGASA